MQAFNTTIPALPIKNEEAIINTLIDLKNNAKKAITIKQVNSHLKTISKNADLFQPETVKAYIADAKTLKGKPMEPTSKNLMLYAYNCFCQVNKIQWKKPFYKFSPKIPLIPTTENVNKIVSCATTKYALIFSLLIETGAEAHELETVTKNDINTEQGIISIQGCKMHDSGTYKLKQATKEMLQKYLTKHPEQNPFPTSRNMGQAWDETRSRASTKLCQPTLRKIKMQNLRNYSGALLYYKTQDPIAVKRHLRHKKLEQTMHYLSGIATNGDEEYTVKTATTTKEAIALLETGFKYETTIEGIQLYKKRK